MGNKVGIQLGKKTVHRYPGKSGNHLRKGIQRKKRGKRHTNTGTRWAEWPVAGAVSLNNHHLPPNQGRLLVWWKTKG